MSEFKDVGSGFDVLERDGATYTWIPKETNPSKLVLHKWLPEEDRWEPKPWARFLPSKRWNSLKDVPTTSS